MQSNFDIPKKKKKAYSVHGATWLLQENIGKKKKKKNRALGGFCVSELSCFPC